MKIKSLVIKRQESYEADANQLRGVVCLVGDQGEQTIRLSSQSISRIFEMIREDAIGTAKLQAKLVSFAVQEAVDEPLLLEQSA